MVRGRRAADRRRERREAAGVDDSDLDDGDEGTTPGALPASPHDDYEEIEGDASRFQSARPDPSQKPPAIVEPPARTETTSRTKTARVEEDDGADADRNFARELKRHPRDDVASRAKLDITAVRERPGPPAPRGGRLVVLSLSGQVPSSLVTLPLQVSPALLGRAQDADVRIVDPTVSLRHARLTWNAPQPGEASEDLAGFDLVDEGSTSGTLVNGIPIEGVTRLRHGDVLAVGKSELRFVRDEREPVLKPAPTSLSKPAESTLVEHTSTEVRRSRELLQAAHQEALRRAEETARVRRQAIRRRAGWVIAACSGLGIVVAIAFWVRQEVFSDQAPAQVRLQAATLLAEAREKLLGGDVDGATDRVNTLVALTPNDEEARSLERVVRTERSARDALQLALRLGDEDRDEEAMAALERIADRSVFVRDRDRLRSALQERSQSRSLRVIESLLEHGQREEAGRRLQAHLERFPDDEAARALRTPLQRTSGDAGWDPGLASARVAFLEGRLDDAQRLALAAGFQGYARDVERFQRVFHAGQAALSRLDGSAARAPLDEAFRLLLSLGASAQAPIFAAVQKPFANALYLSGTEKLEHGDGCGAARDLHRAMRLLPDDPRLLAEQQELATRAEQGLTLARGARPEDPERARALAREALCFARTGTKTWDELLALAR
jgi:pSer/pThr/pTyr-binding forkhead associated (FHA) protein